MFSKQQKEVYVCTSSISVLNQFWTNPKMYLNIFLIYVSILSVCSVKGSYSIFLSFKNLL